MEKIIWTVIVRKVLNKVRKDRNIPYSIKK
jgi:hypothetical protein